jgi:hypothetical protein
MATHLNHISTCNPGNHIGVHEQQQEAALFLVVCMDTADRRIAVIGATQQPFGT